MAGFADVAALESRLKATTAHAKGHGVHVDVIEWAAVWVSEMKNVDGRVAETNIDVACCFASKQADRNVATQLQMLQRSKGHQMTKSINQNDQTSTESHFG